MDGRMDGQTDGRTECKVDEFVLGALGQGSPIPGMLVQ